MYFFTADEHFGHKNIIRHCNRPFKDLAEMTEALIDNNNSVVSQGDTVIHAGDFAFKTQHSYTQKLINSLNGNHIFLKGNHDQWAKKLDLPHMLEMKLDGQFMVISHYALRTWNRSYYGSWNLFGHSHGNLVEHLNQKDIGVDTNNYFPYSFDDLKAVICTDTDTVENVT